jgi:hypothetical protein
LHVGDTVQVIYGGPSQAGFMQYGEVVAQPTAARFTVHFPDGANITDELGNVVTLRGDLSFTEDELDKTSI